MINKEKTAQKIIDHFFSQGARVSKKDYDFILECLEPQESEWKFKGNFCHHNSAGVSETLEACIEAKCPCACHQETECEHDANYHNGGCCFKCGKDKFYQDRPSRLQEIRERLDGMNWSKHKGSQAFRDMTYLLELLDVAVKSLEFIASHTYPDDCLICEAKQALEKIKD